MRRRARRNDAIPPTFLSVSGTARPLVFVRGTRDRCNTTELIHVFPGVAATRRFDLQLAGDSVAAADICDAWFALA